MTSGFRLRGKAGNVQITDDVPTFVVAEKGVISAANFTQDAEQWFFGNRHTVNFASTYASQAPPLVFLKFLDGTRAMSTITMIGSPGGWTGFRVCVGVMTAAVVPQPSNLSWFIAIQTPGPSSAKKGIRIRNRVTGALMFDSGWPLVKFVKQSSSFQALGRVTHEILRYGIGYPPGDVYFMANGVVGTFGRAGDSVYYFFCGIDASYPNYLLCFLQSTGKIPYQSYLWTVLFATPGN